MKKIILAATFFFSTLAFAGNTYAPLSAYNTCAPWDGHAVGLTFQSSLYENTQLHITLFKFSKWNLTFNLKNGEQKGDGQLRICGEDFKEGTKFGTTFCTFPNAKLTFKNPVNNITEGQIIEGVLDIQNQPSINFKMIAPAQKNAMCG